MEERQTIDGTTVAENKVTKENTDKDYPEIFIGLVSLVGIDTRPVVVSLQKHFKELGYQPIHIKITEHFPFLDESIFATNILKNCSAQKRIEKYIDFGNAVRKKTSNDFWAQNAIFRVSKKRGELNKKSSVVYIIDQLKTENEIKLLKSVYGKAFFQISIHSARDKRVNYLAKQKAKACNNRNGNPYRAAAEALVERDYKEKSEYGQNAGKIFPLADFIVTADNVEEHSIEQQIGRFVELLFGSNKHSPNHMECGMYFAHAAALRSLDLSRQVGAAIFRPTGEFAICGCNEVPKAGGGTYWCDTPSHLDAREYKKGQDSNEERKNELLDELKNILKKNCTKEEKQILEKIISKKEKEFDNSQFMDALEYGRIVHAEMNAITDAARLGIPLKDTVLYCTTFPCHMCAKHIISSGIKNVIFLEPYPKSLTADMHPDAVNIEGAARYGYENYPAVEFNHFYGVTAERYQEIFRRGKRKNEEGFQEYKNGKDDKPQPIFAPYQVDYPMEKAAIDKFTESLDCTTESADKI